MKQRDENAIAKVRAAMELLEEAQDAAQDEDLKTDIGFKIDDLHELVVSCESDA